MFGIFIDGLLVARKRTVYEVQKLVDALLKQDPYYMISWRPLNIGEYVTRVWK